MRGAAFGCDDDVTTEKAGYDEDDDDALLIGVCAKSKSNSFFVCVVCKFNVRRL